MKSLYSSRHFTSYQCDRGRCFYIDFNHKVVRLSFCQLLAFRQQIKNIDMEAHFNGTNPHGIEIVQLCNREHIFVFSSLEAADLKEFIKGTFAMMELNSLVTF